MFSCYAPQTGCSDVDKDSFWDLLTEVAATCPPDDYAFICGDLNGHVGARNHYGFSCHGNNGHGLVNNDGLRILEFAEALEYRICNTYYIKRSSHLVTKWQCIHSN